MLITIETIGCLKKYPKSVSSLWGGGTMRNPHGEIDILLLC